MREGKRGKGLRWVKGFRVRCGRTHRDIDIPACRHYGLHAKEAGPVGIEPDHADFLCSCEGGCCSMELRTVHVGSCTTLVCGVEGHAPCFGRGGSGIKGFDL